jgi:hypothetical protein
MTAKCTVKWMTNTTTPDGKKYIDRWIFPRLGCNEDIPRFGKRPVGDLLRKACLLTAASITT